MAQSAPGAYSYFLLFQPVARAGYSIYICHLTAEESNQAREELRLPHPKIDPGLP